MANFDQHDEYRRGRAVDRQDAPTVDVGTGVLTHTVVEESEEVSTVHGFSAVLRVDSILYDEVDVAAELLLVRVY